MPGASFLADKPVSELHPYLKGTLYVGFLTSDPDNHLFTKVLKAGDIFALPIGLIHFHFIAGSTNVLAFSSLDNQNPERITIANTVFGSNHLINPDVIAKAIQLDKNVVNYLKKQFSSKNI